MATLFVADKKNDSWWCPNKKASAEVALIQNQIFFSQPCFNVHRAGRNCFIFCFENYNAVTTYMQSVNPIKNPIQQGSNFKPGDLVAGLFSGAYYRCRISSIRRKDRIHNVRFIDFGNVPTNIFQFQTEQFAMSVDLLKKQKSFRSSALTRMVSVPMAVSLRALMPSQRDADSLDWSHLQRSLLITATLPERSSHSMHMAKSKLRCFFCQRIQRSFCWDPSSQEGA